MRIYHLKFLVHDKLEVVAEQLFQASALVRAECPFESLFFLRNHLQETKWCSLGSEKIVIASKAILETELPSTQLQKWRQATDPTLLLKVSDLLSEEEDLALSA